MAVHFEHRVLEQLKRLHEFRGRELDCILCLSIRGLRATDHFPESVVEPHPGKLPFQHRSEKPSN